jgi:HlyD family secretion protein
MFKRYTLRALLCIARKTQMKIKIIHTLTCLFLLACGGVSNTSVETHAVTRSEFINSITVTGELEAVRSKVISAPPVRFGMLKIVKIVEDGTQVQTDDLLIQFDKGEVQKSINDAQSELQIAEAELRKTQANQKSEIESMAIDLEIARINHQIAQLKVEQSVFKAEIDRKQLELKLEDADIALERAAQELEKNIHREEISKLQVKAK